MRHPEVGELLEQVVLRAEPVTREPRARSSPRWLEELDGLVEEELAVVDRLGSVVLV